MNAAEILSELERLGDENTKKMYLKHGASGNLYGVRFEDLKKIQKRIKKNHELALALYDSGISEAMYLAGLIADEKQITREDLQKWAEKSDWHTTSEFTIAKLAADSVHGWDLALEWIESEKELIAGAGWATLSSLVSIKPDAELDLEKLESLLERVEKEIHSAQNRVRYTMNGFVIAVGSYVARLSEKAVKTAQEIGKVEVNMGETACQTPDAKTYIEKCVNAGKLGKKRKAARC